LIDSGRFRSKADLLFFKRFDSKAKSKVSYWH
jgi:hypothetical protein